MKHLEGKLWEMRMCGRDGIARSIYVTASGRGIVILNSFIKKTDKTPRGALSMARARAKAVEYEEKKVHSGRRSFGVAPRPRLRQSL